MKWSFSAANAFRSCQRSWFFKNCLASGVSRDPVRREAYLLSKLQSTSGWRGQLVDRILSEELIEGLRRQRPVTKADLLRAANRRFHVELEYALNHRIRTANAKLADGSFPPALRAVEYGETVGDEEILQAWIEVQRAIESVFEFTDIRNALKSSSYVIAQRQLQFNWLGTTVKAVPDVIAFFDKSPPLIVDWKVHTFGSREYRRQLVLYAMALSRCVPHRDFPINLADFEPTTYRLTEAQLLTGISREYAADQADFDELEDHIAASASEMLAATKGLRGSELRAHDFPATQWPELCQRCAFRKLCWEDDNVSDRNEHLPDHEFGGVVEQLSLGGDSWVTARSGRVFSE